MKNKKLNTNQKLLSEIIEIVTQGKPQIAQAINIRLIATYWHIGKQINEYILKHKRTDYGKQILQSLSTGLTKEYGKGWSAKQLRHCLRFAETFPDIKIISKLWRQSNWSHFKTTYLKIY